MAYRIEITRPAETDIYSAYEYLRERVPAAADGWLRGLFAAIHSLDQMPSRCPLIPETDDLDRDVRQLLYGRRSGIHRIIFDVDSTAEGAPRVRILRIWHGARDRIRLEDLE